MEERAKLFEIDGDQAVLLHKEFEFESQEEVVIRREGGRVILEPVNPSRRTWSQEFLDLGGSAPDFPEVD
jgi:virulence-associated protein VagC